MQQVESRTGPPSPESLLNDSIRNTEEALQKGTSIEDFDWASLMMLLGNNYMARSELPKNKSWEADIDTAIRIFDELAKDRRIEHLQIHRCRLYNNISTAWRVKEHRSKEKNKEQFRTNAKRALLRALELSAAEGQIDVWSGVQYNLGATLAEAAARSDPGDAQFLRIQSIAAFNASLEAYPQTVLNLQMARTHLALGHVLLETAKTSPSGIREAYLVRTIGEYEAAAHILDKDTDLTSWSNAKFGVGVAFFLHAEISEPEGAIADLENALKCFDEAEPGVISANEPQAQKRLEAARAETKTRLDKLRDLK